MAKEIERKFLINKNKFTNLTEGKLIKQGYIMNKKDKQLRIRVIDDKSFICLKYTENKIRDEYEYEIPLVDGREILAKCENRLEKIRTIIKPIDSTYVIEVDRYPNGLVVAEVEFKTQEECDNFIPMPWFGIEITGDKQYSNVTLAKQKLYF